MIETYLLDSEHSLSIFAIIFTLELMLIINYQQGRPDQDTDIDFIHIYVKNAHPRDVLYDTCMSLYTLSLLTDKTFLCTHSSYLVEQFRDRKDNE